LPNYNYKKYRSKTLACNKDTCWVWTTCDW